MLESDAAVRHAVEAVFGAEIFAADGMPDRARLRELIFADPVCRSRLEQILHPAIRTEWMARAAAARQAGSWLLVDIPLLYETATEVHLDRVIVVGCSWQTQRRRLLIDRALSADTADRMVAAQLDLATKMKRADHLVWNDSTRACLEAQANLLTNWLIRHYG